MKRSFKSIIGVTLLEIMLVLAIAAMVIVMSIRYYQSASLNQKIAATMNNVTGIIAAAESYLAGAGNLSAISDANLTPYLPGNVMPNSGWVGAMSVTPATANSYTINIPNVPGQGCNQLRNLVSQNSKLNVAACSGSVQTLTITVTE